MVLLMPPVCNIILKDIGFVYKRKLQLVNGYTIFKFFRVNKVVEQQRVTKMNELNE